MMRSHRAGDLRADDIGGAVVICGWVASRRDHGGKVFLDVRDVAGIVQVVVDPQLAGLEVAHRLRHEWVVRVVGEVSARPEGTVNVDLPTGAVEVIAREIEVLSEADPPPFPLDDRVDVEEVLRLRHRYLDLRRAPMQRNLRLRAAVNRVMREAMAQQDFVEIETPMLIASTPEGARDFVVPSRLRPGAFYALPQSPQLFKQLLMVGGLDRYFQIARCARDEDLRADRQFEFMQLDVEMTFADKEDVLAAISQAVLAATSAARPGEGAGERTMVREVLGQLRLDLGRPPVTEGLEFTWVVEFPLFEGFDEAGRPMPAHHAFTAPHPDDLARLESDPLSVRSRSYDLVLNGWELGSGSERIYRPEVQQRILSLLRLDPHQSPSASPFLPAPF